MEILIIESEAYLAQSIATKLADTGHNSHTISSLEEIANDSKSYDIVLLSISAVDADLSEIIEHYKDSIIILMVSYVTDDTVSKPLKNGVRDYIVKPFMMDELVRKIEHYRAFKELESDIRFYKSYFRFIQDELQIPELPDMLPPMLIKASSQRSADIYAMKYAIERGLRLEFISLKNIEWKTYNFDKYKNYYIINIENLKKQERKEFLEKALNFNMILSLIADEKVSFPNVVDITNMANNLEIGSEILSIKEYERIVITKFEGRYPDVELAKKLGMSRKSLWEKRKKYGITRKK
ncbi:response regulator [Helicobacter saguini]|uniref:Response regulator n=1 Tax=Helicobacter saguini TaxID=1548018 RepID=A0A347VR32_9HELI|nr:response regulator [Helicobacter saguini]MWV63053.1 response regulator [Helicobacter saguini]MWV66278.1 response regulator [Helicobacter saguini]MWV68630.1 response regulator [Helicobacter saguini]MWV71819.1 response regulator [Helicobacter saguini]TLD95844.1 response regulator [Helicobacter saguini]